MPRLAPGESRAFFFCGFRGSPADRVFYGAARPQETSLNFVTLIDLEFFDQNQTSGGQFRNGFPLTLPRARRQDATDFAAAN
jgi:hypothetical protein